MKQKLILKKDKATAGLTILLSLIVMLFCIGLIVMIFSLMSGSLILSTYTVTNVNAVNESINKPTTAGITLAGAGFQDGTCGSVTAIFNGSGGISITLANITQTGCILKNTTSTTWSNSTWLVTYPYVYNANNTATNVMSKTGGAVSGVTTYFPLFITIGAMVVLILLTIIIIVSIRSSGLVNNEMQSGARNVGTA